MVFFLFRINPDSLTGDVDVENAALGTEGSSGCSSSLTYPLILQGAVRDMQAGKASLLLAQV